jgi:hypothetical protein
MKAKQLPNGLDHWLKTRTVVIGGGNSLQTHANGPAPRRQQQQEETGATVPRRGLFVPPIAKLVSHFKFETRSAGCFARANSR